MTKSANFTFSDFNTFAVTNVAALANTYVPSGVNKIYVKNYTTDGDGGEHYRVRISTPTSPTAWQKQSGDGSWWDVVGNILNVLMFGADSSGNSDSTNAFSYTAQAVPANSGDNIVLSDQPACDWAAIRIPYGIYTLNSLVDTGNKEIVWVLDPGAEIINPQYLNGRLYRQGYKVIAYPHHGIAGNATTFSVQANRTPDNPPGVSGFTHPANISAGNGSDSVALYVDNLVPATLYSANAVSSYSATSVTLSTSLTSDQLKKMRKGMMVQTRHSPQNYRGMVNGWTANSISVEDGWFLVDGSQMGTASTPTGTDGLDVSPFRSGWAINANMYLDTNSYGNGMTGFELGMQNTKGDISADGGSVSAVGMQIIQLKSSTATNYRIDTGYLTSGEFRKAFRALRGAQYAFIYEGNTGGGTTAADYLLYGVNADSHTFYTIDGSGNVKMGLTGVASTPTIDFLSSGLASSFDTRIQASAGSATDGSGQLTVKTSAVNFAAVARPASDNTYSLGQPAYRWSSLSTTLIRVGDGTIIWKPGAGSPEGVFTAPVGSLYTRTDGGAGTTFYVKESGTGNTGWIAK